MTLSVFPATAQTQIPAAPSPGTIVIQTGPTGTVTITRNGVTTTLAPGTSVVGGVTFRVGGAPANSQTPQQSAGVEAAFLSSDWFAALAKADTILAAHPTDTRALYFGGYAAYSVGSFARARHDWSAVGDFKPYDNWASARDLTRKVEGLQRLAPLKTTDVSIGGRVVFHVFFDERDAWTNAMIALLPRAYEINRQITGADARETPVFIFSDESRYTRFQAIRNDNVAMGSWAWAGGDASGLYLCQHLGDIVPQNTNSSYFRSTVVHELNHSLVRRLTGNAVIPRWFEEGLAMQPATRIAPDLATAYSWEWNTMRQASAILPLDDMTTQPGFREATERNLAHKSPAAPYSQAWAMTNYFLSLVPPANLPAFLEDVRAGRDFNRSLKKFTTLTPQDFYDKWRADEANSVKTE